MGAFHSGTDQDYVDKNFPVSITVAKKGQGGLEFDAVSHQTTQCGKGTTGKGTVKYVAPTPTFDTEAFMKEAEDNIDKGKRPLYLPSAEVHRRAVVYRDYGMGYQNEGYINTDGSVMSEKEYQRHIKEIWEDD